MHFCKALKMYLETIQSPAGMNTSGSKTQLLFLLTQIIISWPNYQLTMLRYNL